MSDQMLYHKLRCGGFSFEDDPAKGLGVEGSYVQYLCPSNYKLRKGIVGLRAYIQGQEGLYEIHWYWVGRKFESKHREDKNNLALTMPVPARELAIWHGFFRNITLKKIKRRSKQ